MRKIMIPFTMSLFITACIITSSTAFADQGRKYEVTITNITRGQVITPPIVISHEKDFQLFTLGAPAISQLATLAEDGITNPLIDYVATLPSVLDYTVATVPLMPGESVTLEITTRGHFRFISALGMLATTNDAFFAIQGVRVPVRGEKNVKAEAYDAGSEANNEDCDFIPGPPCGNAGVRDTDNAEGYVHIHAGIHGISDLDPAMHDWRNPVATITIRR